MKPTKTSALGCTLLRVLDGDLLLEEVAAKKGKSERIVIRRNFFRDAGQRAVNIGGSTGLAFFRPAVQRYEARDVRVEGNHFVGSEAPIAFVTAVDCQVRLNTIVHPGKWVLRILQEQPLDRFMPCQGGVFEGNLVLFDHRVRIVANIGPDTRAETFVFRGNAWYDTQGDRPPPLPAPLRETEGVYRVNPLLADPEREFFRRPISQ